MTPTMTGHTIERIECGAALDIYSREGGDLRVENEYVLERPLEPTLSTSEGQESEIVRALQDLVGTVVGDVTMNGGGLVVELDGGARLVVEADQQFESWSYYGPGKEIVVSTPGGELAIWE